MLLVYSTEAASLIGQTALIQNNNNVHHLVATGTTAVTSASTEMCVCVYVYVHVSVCLRLSIWDRIHVLFSGDRSVKGKLGNYHLLFQNMVKMSKGFLYIVCINKLIKN